MSSQSHQSRVLRIGVLQGGRITDERLLKRVETVTVGRDPGSTVVLPGSDVPQRFPLFEATADAYRLVFSAEMSGRVQLDEGRDASLSGLIESGAALPHPQGHALPLNERSRGKVVVGGVTVFFQFVVPPAEVGVGPLPRELRGNLFTGMDRAFLVALAASLAVHFTCGTGILLSPMPVEPEIELEELLQDRFASLLETPKAPPPPPEPDGANAQGPATDREKPVAEAPAKERQTAVPSAERMAAAKSRVANLGLVGAINASGGGSVADVLGSGDGLSADFASALSGVTGVGVATADAVKGGPKGGQSGAVAGVGDLATSGGGDVDLGGKQDATVRGRVTSSSPDVDSADVNPADVAKYVKARLKAIQNCYERELKRNPTLKGRVVVAFTIGTSGRTSAIEVEENTLGSEAVGTCIRSLIRTWAFPFRPDGDVPVSYPFVFAPAS